MRSQQIDHKCIPDKRGDMHVAEVNSGMPFVARRMFYIHSPDNGARRGGHAHRRCQQLLVCMSGGIKVTASELSSTGDFYLSVGKSLYVPPGVWVDLVMGPDSILLVLASEAYDEWDYVHSLQEFQELARALS